MTDVPRIRTRTYAVDLLLGTVALGVLGVVWAHAGVGFGGTGVDELFSRWVNAAVFVAAGLACSLHAGFRRGPIAWLVVGIGLLSFAGGNLVYGFAPDLEAVPVPSISDPLWLGVYPCEYIALLLLTRRRVGRTLLATRLDGLVSGLAIAAVLACVSLPAALAGSSGEPLAARLTNLAYPVADLILLGAVVSAVALSGWRFDRLWVLLAAAILSWEAADLIYLLGVGGTIGNTADALVMTGGIGLAAAARSDRGTTQTITPSERGLYVPIGFGIVALGVLALDPVLHLEIAALALASLSIALVLARMALALRENRGLLRASQMDATTDALTGLSNRRKLQQDLGALVAGDEVERHVLVLLDLNGFKTYNDSYGHGAGDALLARLGTTLDDSFGAAATTYRMGGDEFCVLAPAPEDVDAFTRRCAEALSTHGDGFSITAAHGVVSIPQEATEPSRALAIADARMYRDKNAGRPPAAKQSAGVLIAVIEERAPGLAHHVNAVAALACAIGLELGLDAEELEALACGAALHDIGKMAIPEAILEKPGELSAAEWELIKQHTLIGERILTAAPALHRSAQLVRSSHERVDGCGYPDGLAGDAIPLGSRIILVADAFDAMTSKRAYGPTLSESDALAELRRCAGSQFDPRVVEAATRAVADRSSNATARAA